MQHSLGTCPLPRPGDSPGGVSCSLPVARRLEPFLCWESERSSRRCRRARLSWNPTSPGSCSPKFRGCLSPFTQISARPGRLTGHQVHGGQSPCQSGQRNTQPGSRPAAACTKGRRKERNGENEPPASIAFRHDASQLPVEDVRSSCAILKCNLPSRTLSRRLTVPLSIATTLFYIAFQRVSLYRGDIGNKYFEKPTPTPDGGGARAAAGAGLSDFRGALC